MNLLMSQRINYTLITFLGEDASGRVILKNVAHATQPAVVKYLGDRDKVDRDCLHPVE